MTEDQILSELRTIRTLLAFDKQEELQMLIDELDKKDERILEELDFQEWKSRFSEELADELDVSKRTIQRTINNLEEAQLVESQGQGAGKEYRKTGLIKAAELVTE